MTACGFSLKTWPMPSTKPVPRAPEIPPTTFSSLRTAVISLMASTTVWSVQLPSGLKSVS
jgi:hypothetical protein